MKNQIVHKKLMSVLAFVLAFSMISSRILSQGLMVYGYADFEVNWENPDGSGDSQFYFDDHHFNMVVFGQITGNLFADVEVEYEHAGTELNFEYGYIGYTGIKNLRIMAGKFIIPFGRFNKDLHATWINKMIDRPNGFKNILPQTYSDVGIWLSGAIPMNNGTRVTYDMFAINGLMGPDGGDIRGMRGNARDKFPGGGRDNSKTLGGRLGFEFAPQGLDFGVSVLSGNYSDDPVNDLSLTWVGADAAFRKSGFELRGEIIHANQESSEGDLKKTGGYGQLAYLIKSRYEPVVRYSSRNMPGDSGDKSRLSIGFNYYLSPSSVVRLNYHFNLEDKDEFKKDNNVIAAQFTLAF